MGVVQFHDTPTYGHSKAGALLILVAGPIEAFEDQFVLFHRYPRAVVADFHQPICALPANSYTDILGLLSTGASHKEILDDYPVLEEDDILAALEYGAAQTDHAILIAA